MQVKLSIKKTIHQDYLNFLFTRNEKGEFVVTRTEDFGKMLTSMVRYSSYPVKKHGNDLIDLLLPDTRPDLLNHLNFLLRKYNNPIASRIQDKNATAKEKITNFIHLVLPDSKPLENATNYYLFYSKEDESKLNDAIEVFFNLDFDSYYLQGKKLGMQQKDIIQAFILSRKLINLIGDNETLKKRKYRDELKMQKIYLDQLISKAYRRHECIEKSLIEYNYLTAK